MNYFKNSIYYAVITLGMAITLLACTPTGKIGEMSKFDITTASREDIAEALNKDGRVAISGGILFEHDSDKLTPDAENIVMRVAEVMKEDPDLKIAVVGNTDNTGDFNYNIKLSERRANAFVNALVKNGVGTNRLAAVGVGPLSPVTTNDTSEGRAQNRRVELVLIR